MPRASSLRSVGLTAVALGLLVSPVSGQVIGLKTVPLVAGDQFLIYPSANLGMGGARIARADVLADPFSNPATGARSEGSRVVSAPTFYSISGENGGARTMPVGAHFGAEHWFGGGLVALQDLDQGAAAGNWQWVPPLVDGDWSIPNPRAMSNRSATNRFAHVYLGRAVGDWSFGASALVVGVNGTDGVEQLYANAWEIEERGSVTDIRLGVTGDLGGDRTVELALVRSRAELTQDVTTVTWELTDSVDWLFTPEIEDASHRNITETWGAMATYRQPLDAPGWSVGGSVTVNRKDHPKIPTYDLTAVQLPERPPIPRDPGNSWAFVIGAGIAFEEGPTTFALDIAYEPAVSDTWADELTDVVAADGSIIPAGGHTVDNHFEFENASARVGLQQEFSDGWAFQLGVRMKSYSYHMDQEDHVLGLERDLTQQWTEWTPTWGLNHDLNGVRLQYVGMASSAGHFPFPSLGGTEVLTPGTLDASQPGGDILAPPAGRLATPDETTVTHRLQVSVPIG